MRINQRKRRLQRQTATTPEPTLNHAELVARGRALGLPGFIGSWPTKTLALRVKALEADHDRS